MAEGVVGEPSLDFGAIKIRPLVRGDLELAIAAIRDGGWGDRRHGLEFYVGHPNCQPILAESQGAIVGTAVATWSGTIGWLGLVFVAPAARGRGLGAALTRASLDILGRGGCRSVLLAATNLGQPIYKRLGFLTDGAYAVWHGPRPAHPGRDPRVRRLTSDDFAAILALDARTTSEDRAHLLRALGEGWVIVRHGRIAGYALRTPWGFGPAIAEQAEDGATLLDVLLDEIPPGSATITVPTANAAAMAHLSGRGFVLQRELPRMRLGEPVAWEPTSIWAICNFAVG